MTTRDKLYENYEDALFMLLLAEVAEKEGGEYLVESERLNKDDSAAIPEMLDKKCSRLIRREFSTNKRLKASRNLWKIVNRAAVIALVSILMFTTAYALVPEVRIITLNMLIEMSDVATSLTFSGNVGSVTNEVTHGGFFGYTIPDMPDGYNITEQGGDSRLAWIVYENDDGAVISIDIGGSTTSIINVDTEDAENIEQIIIHGYEGLVIEKGNRIHIVWGDTDQGKYINIICINMTKEAAISIADSVHR